MSINYTKVGWNSDSFVNPTNINHMDTGIKAACDGVDDLSAGKVDKVSGKGLSTEDYTTAEKTKLAGIATGATKTTIANNLTTTTAGSALDATQGKVLSDLISAVTADTSVHTASGTSLSLQTGKGGMRWQDEAIVGQTIKNVLEVKPKTNYGITVAVESNGISIKGSSTGAGDFFINGSIKLSTGKKYTYINTTNIRLTLSRGSSYTQVTNIIGAYTFTAQEESHALRFYLGSAGINHDTFGSIMILEGEYTEIPPFLSYGIHSAGDMGFFDGKLSLGSIDGNGNFTTATNRAYTTTPIHLKKDDVVKVETSGTQWLWATYSEDGQYISQGSSWSNSGATFTATADCKIHFVFRNSDNSTLSLGSINPIITINGQYALVVEECGKNLWDERWEVGGYEWVTGKKAPLTDRWRNINPIYVKPSTSYHATEIINVLFYESNGTFISYGAYSNFTTPDNCGYINICKTNENVYKNDIAIIEGTSGEYIPYTSKTYPIPLPHPIRGTGDVKEMVHKVGKEWVMDKKFGVDHSSLRNWGKNSEHIFYCTPDDMYAPANATERLKGVLCTKYNVDTTTAIDEVAMTDKTCKRHGGKFYVKDTSYTDATEFARSLGEDFVLIYELATPTTEPLPNQAAMYEMESYAQQTHIDTADGLATLNVEYGTSDLMATALNGERLAQKAIVE